MMVRQRFAFITFVLLRQNTRQKRPKEEDIEFGSQFPPLQRIQYIGVRIGMVKQNPSNLSEPESREKGMLQFYGSPFYPCPQPMR